MKRKRRIGILPIAVVLCLLITGCGGNQSQTPDLSLAETSAAEQVSGSPFVGSWKLYARDGDIGATHEELVADAEQLGVKPEDYMSLTIRDDGTMSIGVYGVLAESTWTDKGDGSGNIQINGLDCEMTVSDGYLRVDLASYWAVFEPSEKTAAEIVEGSTLPSEIGFQMPEQKPTDSRFVGQWRFYDRDSNDSSLRVAHEDLPKLLEQGEDYAGDYTLIIGEDGWFKITDSYGFERNELTDNGDGTAVLNVGAENCTAAIVDGMLELRSSDSVTRYEKVSDVGDPMAKDEADQSGTIIEKLDGDGSPDRYLVQTENGENLECEYIGFEDLASGTKVVLSKWGDDWMIELPSEWSHNEEEPKEHLYTTADGITVDDLSVQLVNSKLWSFSYTLGNPTDKDAELDPSLFVLKKGDGSEITTMAKLVSKDTVKAGTTYFRISINIGYADAVKLGEKVSFWYDGQFLGTVIAQNS